MKKPKTINAWVLERKRSGRTEFISAHKSRGMAQAERWEWLADTGAPDEEYQIRRATITYPIK